MRLGLLLIFAPIFTLSANAAAPSKWDIYQSLVVLQTKLLTANLSPVELANVQKHLAAAKNIMDHRAPAEDDGIISDGPMYDFALVANGGTADKTFSLTNDGSDTLWNLSATGLSAPFTFKGGSYPGTGGTCGSTLPAAASCTVIVTFAPTRSGSYSQTLTVSDLTNTGRTVSTRNVQGAGAPPASLAISDAATYNFGTVLTGQEGDKTLTVANTGGLPASALSGTGVSAPFSFKGGSYPGRGGNCGSSLESGATCTVAVSFYPTSRGAWSGSITLYYFDGAQTQSASRSLTGASR